MILPPTSIVLQARATDRSEAIRRVGELLVLGGCVEPAYVDGMLARERLMSTYVGNGVAIPHGQEENRSQIRRTGIAVLQLRVGVSWEPGEHARLVIGMAAGSDEHVGVLANLADVIDDAELTERLMRTRDPALISEALTRSRPDCQ